MIWINCQKIIPIAQVTWLVKFFIASVIKLFCVGLHLQHTTAGALHAVSRNYYLHYSKASFMLIPSIINMWFELSVLNYLKRDSNSNTSSISLIVNIFYMLDFSLELIDMQIAVSILSPVSIHTKK